MKKFDYYAAHEPWKMPKWLGAALGGIFTVVAVGAAVLIFHLTRPAHANVPAPVAQVAAAPVAAPAVAQVETPAPPATTAPTAEVAAPRAVASHKGHKSAKSAKHSRIAAKPISKDRSNAILAKHDSREKRKAKDDLDRMLGL